ncbi:MAG TPA: tetraacyldisaccharide 4'-kinase [Rhodanobacteraceae bacterium]|nr:tetraacyldisaccharide 4'-kinase [Rhodanobacteraceae bacterium]
MSLRESLQQRWYQDLPPPRWTLPVAALYRAVSSLRRALYRRGWKRSERLPVPVVVVGNITVGGAGKTPLVIALVDALRGRGFRPGVVSRGYGGSAQTHMLRDDDPAPRVVGDEPALIKLRTRAPVAIARDRPRAARLLLDAGANVVIADDGLQHYALGRDVEICVVDGARRFGNARLLPAGPLREPLSRLKGVDFVVCNGGEPRADEIAMRLRAEDASALREPSSICALRSFAGGRVHAVAGIGNPARFFTALREHGMDVIEHAFADHHAYTAHDLRFGDDLPVLMTEKDAVKCRGFAQANWWAVPVLAMLPDGFFGQITEKLVRRA